MSRMPAVGRRTGAILALVVAGLIGTGAATPPEEFRFARWNGTYPDMVEELAPVRQGAFVLDLSSPSNVVVLRSHRLMLTPRPDGTHSATFEVELQAGGDLVGDLSVGGVARPVRDRVVVPPQKLSIPARVRIVPTSTGFDVTPLELPPRITVAIQSQLGNQLLGLCEQFSLLLLGGDCSGFAAIAQKVTVDLPPAGEIYAVPGELVTPEERTALLRYLERTEELGP